MNKLFLGAVHVLFHRWQLRHVRLTSGLLLATICLAGVCHFLQRHATTVAQIEDAMAWFEQTVGPITPPRPAIKLVDYETLVRQVDRRAEHPDVRSHGTGNRPDRWKIFGGCYDHSSDTVWVLGELEEPGVAVVHELTHRELRFRERRVGVGSFWLSEEELRPYLESEGISLLVSNTYAGELGTVGFGIGESRVEQIELLIPMFGLYYRAAQWTQQEWREEWRDHGDFLSIHLPNSRSLFCTRTEPAAGLRLSASTIEWDGIEQFADSANSRIFYGELGAAGLYLLSRSGEPTAFLLMDEMLCAIEADFFAVIPSGETSGDTFLVAGTIVFESIAIADEVVRMLSFCSADRCAFTHEGRKIYLVLLYSAWGADEPELVWDGGRIAATIDLQTRLEEALVWAREHLLVTLR